MSARTRRILTAAAFWHLPCVQCGARGETECHHAVQHCGKRVDHPFACLPLCRHCHRGNNGALTDPLFCRRAIALMITISRHPIDENWRASISGAVFDDALELCNQSPAHARIVALVDKLDAATATENPPRAIPVHGGELL